MPNAIKTFLVALFVSIVLLAAGCETWRSKCGGKIVVENPIPDTTLYVGGEPFRRDLFEPPIVFRQTEKKAMTFVATSSDGGIIVSANGKRNSVGKVTILEVLPKSEGDTQVNIHISDGCGEMDYTFNVTVIDTTQQ